MGKASKWFRSLFNLAEKRSRSANKENNCNPKWSFLKSSCKENQEGARHAKSARCRSDRIAFRDVDNNNDGGYAAKSSRKAIAVAKATASAAEAAVVAAKAAAEVVWLTRSGRHYFRRDQEDAAAVVIQSLFRGYLARRALRALRALVRLQALVRGYIVRKQAVNQVRKMHALIRAQARARAIRASFPASSESSSKTSHSCITDSVTPDITEYATQVKSSRFEQSAKPKRVSSKLNSRALHDQSKIHSGRDLSNRLHVNKIDKILEVDSYKPYRSTKSKSPLHLYDFYSQKLTPAEHSRSYSKLAIPYSSEDLYLQYCQEIDRQSFNTADDSPFFHNGSRSSSARRGAYTPANIDFTDSYLNGGYTDHPNYMAYTKSSKAKLRSLSAPKQRTPQFERSVSLKYYSIQDLDVKRQSAARASCSGRAYNHGNGFLV